nr:MAG TPA: hypothetical protein [Caudoviricetes sp.]
MEILDGRPCCPDFQKQCGKWATDLARAHDLLRSRLILRPLPSGRASLAVPLLSYC